MEQGKGRNTILCLTEKGKKFSLEKIMPLHEIENKIWNEWTAEEQQQYLTLTKKYRDGLKNIWKSCYKSRKQNLLKGGSLMSSSEQ